MSVCICLVHHGVFLPFVCTCVCTCVCVCVCVCLCMCLGERPVQPVLGMGQRGRRVIPENEGSKDDCEQQREEHTSVLFVW